MTCYAMGTILIGMATTVRHLCWHRWVIFVGAVNRVKLSLRQIHARESEPAKGRKCRR